MYNAPFPGMQIKSEGDITELLKNDHWRMDVLRVAEKKNLPDWWIGAGFLRNLVWDVLEGNEPDRSRDIDLVYFNETDVRQETDWQYDSDMKAMYPDAEWEVRNQARMHYVNGFQPFKSTADGISHWVETATCVAVKLESGELKFLFCHGTDDLLNLVARPVGAFKSPERISTFYERIENKRWKERWPHLRVEVK